jgi:hypothetical protein
VTLSIQRGNDLVEAEEVADECQRAHFELTARPQRAHDAAALLTGCADDGDELLCIRHGCSPVSGLLVENKIGFHRPSMKPILLDNIYRL